MLNRYRLGSVSGQKLPDFLSQRLQMVLYWWSYRIHPVGRTKLILERFGQTHVLNAKGNDDDIFIYRALDLTLNLRRFV
jgi:hypothetical protein